MSSTTASGSWTPPAACTAGPNTPMPRPNLAPTIAKIDRVERSRTGLRNRGTSRSSHRGELSPKEEEDNRRVVLSPRFATPSANTASAAHPGRVASDAVDVAGDMGASPTSDVNSEIIVFVAPRRAGLRSDGEDKHAAGLATTREARQAVPLVSSTIGRSGSEKDLRLRTPPAASVGALRRRNDSGDPTGDSLADDAVVGIVPTRRRRDAHRFADSIIRAFL